MSPSASVQSIDAIRGFRAVFQQFCEDVRAAMVDVELEMRRGRQWLFDEQPAHWRNELRKSDDALIQAKADLLRARMRTLADGSTPSCMDERKALDRAQHRLTHAEEKLMLTGRWAGAADQEVGEFDARATQLSTFLDAAAPLALAFLDRSVIHLESYAAGGAPLKSSPSRASGSSSKDESATPVKPVEDSDAVELPNDSAAETMP